MRRKFLDAYFGHAEKDNGKVYHANGNGIPQHVKHIMWTWLRGKSNCQCEALGAQSETGLYANNKERPRGHPFFMRLLHSNRAVTQRLILFLVLSKKNTRIYTGYCAGDCVYFKE